MGDGGIEIRIGVVVVGTWPGRGAPASSTGACIHVAARLGNAHAAVLHVAQPQHGSKFQARRRIHTIRSGPDRLRK